MKGLLILSLIFFILSLNKSFADIRNKNEFGLHLGDPIAFALKIPVKKNTFFNAHAGIWTWKFWHDIHYDTPYLSVDYAYLFPFRESSNSYYIGIGMTFFFADNPKDTRDYDRAAAIRIPLGFNFYEQGNFSFSFELAPIYQIAPPFNFKPYIIELNGGLVLMISF
jgi:hypothetical protein